MSSDFKILSKISYSLFPVNIPNKANLNLSSRFYNNSLSILLKSKS